MLLPWRCVLGSLGLAPLLLAAHTVMRPQVLGARDDEEEDLGENAHVLFAGSFNPMHSGHLALLAHAARRHPRSKVFACVAYNPSKAYAVSPQVRCGARGEHPLATAAHTQVIPHHKWHMARDSSAQRDTLQHGVARRAQRSASTATGTHPNPTEQVRCELVASMVAAAGLTDRVEAVVVPQYPWRFGLRRGVVIMYRGVRTWQKDGTAESVLAALNVVGPLLLAAALPPDTRYIEASPELLDLSSTMVRKRAAAGESLVGLVPKSVEARVAELYSR